MDTGTHRIYRYRSGYQKTARSSSYYYKLLVPVPFPYPYLTYILGLLPLSPSKRSGEGSNATQPASTSGGKPQPLPKPPRNARKIKQPPTDSSVPASAPVTPPRSSGPPHFSVVGVPPSSHNPVPLGLLSISAPLPQAALVSSATSLGGFPPALPSRVAGPPLSNAAATPVATAGNFRPGSGTSG